MKQQNKVPKYKVIRLEKTIYERLQAVADSKGMSIKHLADQVLGEYATEQIRIILVRNGIKLE